MVIAQNHRAIRERASAIRRARARRLAAAEREATTATATTATAETRTVRSLIEIATQSAWSCVGGTASRFGSTFSAMPEPYEVSA
jgi:hypothetical protein